MFLPILFFNVLLSISFVSPCALPYWWVQQYHIPLQYYQPPQGQPKTTYRYRETISSSDPYNYIHVKEYSEFTWWEYDSSNSVPPGFGPPSKKDTIFPENNLPPAAKGNLPPAAKGNLSPAAKGNLSPAVKGNLPPPAVKNNLPPADNLPKASTNILDRVTTPKSEKNEGERNENEKSEGERNEREKSDIIFDDLDTGDAGNNIDVVADESTIATTTKKNKKSGGFFDGFFGRKKTEENETQPCQVAGSDIHSLRSMIEKMFSLPRDDMLHPDSKEKAREDILKKFRDLGLQVWTQNFTTPLIPSMNGTDVVKEGVNLIGVIPGSQRGKLDDGIVLVGAHYDTVSESNGVDDNGSGLAVMLEIAQAISQARCRLNNTLMFVAFDLEEDGALGSNHFVDHYLIPEELKRARGHFQGAFILDGIMNFNNAPDTQELPLDYAESLPGLQYFVNNTGNRGNFLAMISRNNVDSHLTKQLMDAWQNLGENHYKLYNLAVNMGNHMPSPPVIQNHMNFLTSDHATFWYHNSSTHFPETLNAVLLTDTGPFRGQMKKCYHSQCDDLTAMSPEKLQFAKKTADALTATLVELTKATAGGNNLELSAAIFFMQLLLAYFTIIKTCI